MGRTTAFLAAVSTSIFYRSAKPLDATNGRVYSSQSLLELTCEI
jgi:hypothetical protein